jgi:hypothetical protein
MFRDRAAPEAWQPRCGCRAGVGTASGPARCDAAGSPQVSPSRARAPEPVQTPGAVRPHKIDNDNPPLDRQ